MGVYGMFNSMIISGKKEFRPNLDINLSCLNVRVLVSHQKSKLFVIVNYGWILDFEVSNGQSFRPYFNLTDFLPSLRIIFFSVWDAISLSLEETFTLTIGPLTH